MAARLDRSKWVAKNQALSVYCLSAKELDSLDSEERPNPRAKRGPPMRLYRKEHLERAAIARWGSLAGLEAERQRRQERREQRAITSYFRKQQAEEETGDQPQQRQQQQGQQQQQQQQQQAHREQLHETHQDGVPPASLQQQHAELAVGQLSQHVGAGGSALGAAPSAAAAAASPAACRVSFNQRAWLQALPPLIAERVSIVPRQLRQGDTAAAGAQPLAAHAAQLEQQPGQYVLYWIKSAVRGHENPALDAAAAAARQMGVPLLAAAFLLAGHPYASARRYTFLLEGLRDVQAALRRQGVELLVFLEGWSEQQPTDAQQTEAAQQVQQAQQQRGSRGPAPAAAPEPDPCGPEFSFHPRGLEQWPGWQALVRLAAGAALVVTEDMPVPPDADWLQALAQELPPAVPMAAVDTACVLPMRLVRKCHDKAYAFRAATEGQRRQRITRVYPMPGAAAGSTPTAAAALGPAAVVQAALQGLPPLPAELCSQQQLGWQPLELAGVPEVHLPQRLAQVLAGCQGIDHSVPAVSHMLGGSGAGYARWEAFRKKGLSLYATRRNDAMQRDGVSRLSAYHHWGMVSPFKIAREASIDKSAGAAKFLDELLVWREIGFNLCLHRYHDLHSLAALPLWARATLEEHGGDPRPMLLPYRQLEKGASGDAFWDAAQRQLVKTGELHNNVRMTWCKALLAWTPSPQAALSAALHLNHRWALDGCDPASYSGVLWGFGLYDNPKAAASTPISGSLAQRSTASHARRLPPAAYAQLPA